MEKLWSDILLAIKNINEENLKTLVNTIGDKEFKKLIILEFFEIEKELKELKIKFDSCGIKEEEWINLCNKIKLIRNKMVESKIPNFNKFDFKQFAEFRSILDDIIVGDMREKADDSKYLNFVYGELC